MFSAFGRRLHVGLRTERLRAEGLSLDEAVMATVQCADRGRLRGSGLISAQTRRLFSAR
jgi:hypothetical protein